MKNQWIIFDVMGVIFKVGDDTNDLLVPFVQNRNKSISKEKINEIYLEASLGKITSKEFWKRIEVCPKGAEEKVEKEYLDTCLTIDEQFIEVANRLKNNYHLAILSNDVSEWSIYLRKKYRIDDLIEVSVISGDVNLRKPSEDIYKKTLEIIGADAQNCVFIDDRDKNLKPAQGIGMHIIRFLRDDEQSSIQNVMTVKSFSDIEKSIHRAYTKNEINS